MSVFQLSVVRRVDRNLALSGTRLHMRNPSIRALLLIAASFVAIRAFPCSWVRGYFFQVSALRGTVVGADIGPLQYIRWLRQCFARKHAKLSLYQFPASATQRDMPPIRSTRTDSKGHFDFGNVAPGHYTLIIYDDDWGWSDLFDVEVNPETEQTTSVTIDISPFFPDCKGGHEFFVRSR